jgi:hypothetical protein
MHMEIHTIISNLLYISIIEILKMEAGRYSETFVAIYQTPEDHNINLLSYYRRGYLILLLYIMLKSFIKNMFQ